MDETKPLKFYKAILIHKIPPRGPTPAGSAGGSGGAAGSGKRLVIDPGSLGIVAEYNYAQQVSFLNKIILRDDLAELCRIEAALQVGDLTDVAAGAKAARKADQNKSECKRQGPFPIGGVHNWIVSY